MKGVYLFTALGLLGLTAGFLWQCGGEEKQGTACGEKSVNAGCGVHMETVYCDVAEVCWRQPPRPQPTSSSPSRPPTSGWSTHSLGTETPESASSTSSALSAESSVGYMCIADCAHARCLADERCEPVGEYVTCVSTVVDMGQPRTDLLPRPDLLLPPADMAAPADMAPQSDLALQSASSGGEDP